MHTKIKKILLITAAAAASFCMGIPVMAATAGVEVNEKNFPDEALRDKAAAFDENQDGSLSSEELEKVESIKIVKFLNPDDSEEWKYYEKSDFTFDFKGIEHFTSLKELTVNLSGGIVRDDGDDGDGKHYDSVISNFSKVYKLKNLTSFSFYSAKLEKIDLSKLSRLEKADLDITGLNTLTINNKNLKFIRLWNNTSKIKTLDFRKAPNLKTLYLDNLQSQNVLFRKKNNKLKQLFVTSNGKTQIKKMSITPLKALKKMTMTKVNMKSVDFSQNTKLDDIYVDNCAMKTLDLSKNKKLTWVACEGKKTKSVIIPKKNIISTFKWVNANLSKFSNSRLNPKSLTSVILFGNKIKTLDLKRYKKLDYVSVDRNVKVKLASKLTNKQIVSYLN